MNEQIIAPGEAWEAVERLRITVAYGFVTDRWYATAHHPQVLVACGPTALEALAKLLERIGQTATTQVEVANV